MRIIKNIAKELLGFSRFHFLPEPSPRAHILMYHSIGNNGALFTVKSAVFKKQIEFLVRKNYRIMKLGELVDDLAKKKEIAKKTVVLTFDDGSRDNYFNAFPILKRYNLPATIFLATDFIGREMTNSEGIELAILHWQEILEMNESKLIDFECHTAAHEKLNQLSPKEMKQTLIRNRKEIKSNINRSSQLLAYPKGKYNDEIIGIVKELGFRAAVTTDRGRVDLSEDLFKLPRLAVLSNTGWWQFLGSIS